MALAQNISFAASKHQTLLQEISALDYAGSALEEAEKYVTDLELLKRDAEKRLKDAVDIKQKEWKEHHDLKESIFRKFGHKIVGKGDDWDKKASKEEREYLDAFEKEVKEKDTIAKLKENIKDAKQNVETLRAAHEHREKLNRELGSLYRSVFDGPTPEAPQDDRLEWELRNAEDENNHEQAALNLQAQTLSILADANKALENLINKLKEALEHSEMDMWGADRADALEANAITMSQMLLQQIDTHMDQARRLNGVVQKLPEIKIPRNSMTDIYFDNIWSDAKQHDRISEGLRTAQQAERALKQEMGRAKQRVDAAAANASHTTETVNKARGELFEFRRKTFESIAQHGPTPAYEASPSTGLNLSPPGQTHVNPPFFPSFGAGNDQPGVAPAFPSIPAIGLNAQASGSPSAPNWHNMNPYAALLVRRGTQDDAQPGAISHATGSSQDAVKTQ